MVASLILALLPAQYADSPDFPRDRQKSAIEATVRVVHPETRGEGSGVVVLYENSIAYILTAAHCVPEGPKGDTVDLSFFDAATYPKPRQVITGATVRVRMPNQDLAVIQVPLEQPPVVMPLKPKYGLADEPRYPFPALTVGCDAIGAPAAIVDRVVNRRRIAKPDGTVGVFWEAEKPQHVGRSGGPMIDKAGHVIGICSGTMDKKGYYTHAIEMFKALDRAGYPFLWKGTAKSDVPKNP